MLLQREPRVNFRQVLLEIRMCPSQSHTSGKKQNRMSWPEIAAAINVPIDTVKGWFYRGSSPRYEEGRAILQLHKMLTDEG